MLLVYDLRFFIWANFAVPSACHLWATCIDGRFVSKIRRCGCNWRCFGRIRSSGYAYCVGAGLCSTPRKRAALCTGSAVHADYAANLASHCQSSARCAVVNGGSRNMCRSDRCHRRGAWRTRCTRLYCHQTSDDAGRSVRRPTVSDPQWRSRCLKCGARKMARGIIAVPAQSARCAGPRTGAVGSGFISCARPQSGALGRAL